jgi:hypothetical protein
MRYYAFCRSAPAAFAGLTRRAVALRFARRLRGGLEMNYPRWKLQSHDPLHGEQRVRSTKFARSSAQDAVDLTA